MNLVITLTRSSEKLEEQEVQTIDLDEKYRAIHPVGHEEATYVRHNLPLY
ncbi:MAG TPA: hypothetical protein VFE02_15055 [Candidatus Acidoferrales bacterium]|nr:hypothetical protein [Candidatus Acidoferrales bacterium]